MSSMESSQQLESHFVPTTLGRLRVRTGGEGDAIVFWPSLMMNGKMWLAQAEHFLPNYRVVLIDPPGHGESEPLSRTFSFNECSECVVTILDWLSIPRTHYVGNSWGGMIGGTFVARFPERVDKAVLMNCTASAAGFSQKLEYGPYVFLLKLLNRVPGFLMETAVNAFVGPTTLSERPQVEQLIRDELLAVNGRSVQYAVKSVVPDRPDQHDLLATITTPVLVVAGEEDQTFPVAETKAMADAIPNSQFVVMERTAHLAALENPDEVNRLIESFIAS